MNRSVKMLIVSVAVALVISSLSWFVLYDGSTYIPSPADPGVQYSTLQKGIPLPYSAEYNLASCTLPPNPPLPGGACANVLPSTFSTLTMILDFGFWIVAGFAVLLTAGFLYKRYRFAGLSATMVGGVGVVLSTGTFEI
jgi:hypothetical protein